MAVPRSKEHRGGNQDRCRHAGVVQRAGQEIRSLAIDIDLETLLNVTDRRVSGSGGLNGGKMKALLDLFKQVTPRRIRRDYPSVWPRRKNSFLVVRRSQRAGNHQLPHLQAGARWLFCAKDLWPDQGLRMPVWHKRLKHRGVICESAASKSRCQVRRDRMGTSNWPRRRPHLVPEESCRRRLGHGAGHDVARYRARLCSKPTS